MTKEYFNKEAAEQYLRAEPLKELYGYPAGKGKVYRFRYSNGRIQVYNGGRGCESWSNAVTSWDRCDKFSEEKYHKGRNFSNGTGRRIRRAARRSSVAVTPIASADSLNATLAKALEVTNLLEQMRKLLK